MSCTQTHIVRDVWVDMELKQKCSHNFIVPTRRSKEQCAQAILLQAKLH